MQTEESAAVTGPAWTSSRSGTYPGRFPLSVERHTMNLVDRLVPGVTTVTLNARYYALHGLVASEVDRRGLNLAAAQNLLRRAEVTIGAVSTRHYQRNPAAHEALSRPHAYDTILPQVRAGQVDLDRLAAPQVYAQPNWGFWPAYRGSEMLLRIVTRTNEIGPGERLDQSAVQAGLRDVLELLDEKTLDVDLLDAYEELCVCRAVDSPDGAWLARLLAASGTDADGTRAAVRRQTLRMIARCLQLTEVYQVSTDVSQFVAYAPESFEDRVLTSLDLTAEWRGLILRNHSVAAWRGLWAWLVNGMSGLTTRSQFTDRFAEALPDVAVADFLAGLPHTSTPAGRAAPAEHDPDLDAAATPVRCLGVLCLGARRAMELRGRELHGFQGHDPEDIFEELAPAWLAAQLDRWKPRSLRDFARWLAEVMLNRSQRLALAKARRDPRSGTLKIPTRVHTRDEFVFRDSVESSGGAALRWDQLAGILAGAGLLSRVDGVWTLGPRGDLIV
ncbi:hypothetical protein GCM10027290_02480 [Micromonospora sonneratiae]|uniref:Uncharacterized protein n=1 Tax=Micromonospora sonneratiae TaxID=1184706 RepID=A0ABW3Y5B7_9ACTN